MPYAHFAALMIQEGGFLDSRPRYSRSLDGRDLTGLRVALVRPGVRERCNGDGSAMLWVAWGEQHCRPADVAGVSGCRSALLPGPGDL